MNDAIKTMQVELFESINAFLKTHGGSTPTATDAEQLEAIADKLIALKFDADQEGDYPLEVAITNRLTHERSPFMPIPIVGQDADADDVIDFAILNVALAGARLEEAQKATRKPRKKAKKDGRK